MAYKAQQQFKQFDKAQAWEKIRHYCAYQERCHSDVKDKLYGFGMDNSESDELLSRLIEEDLLNEERFATAFAGGHFRIKKWGRIKITHALKQKHVSAWCIKKALSVIDGSDYFSMLEKLATSKWQLLKGGKALERKFKCKQFLLKRGFESNLIDEVLKLVAVD